ncbi:MAG: hypothetical protein H3C48_16570 [Chitinophagaceae bacterium]|nr:hypothetical protein [Chitinophagaceae bacterium]
MMTTSEVAKVMDTIMSIPGMNETVKMDFRISRKNALLLHSIIERGMDVKEGGDVPGLLENIPQETLQELRTFSEDCLQKAGLTELKDKLKSLGRK